MSGRPDRGGMMVAAQMYGIEDIRLVNIPVPDIQDDELLVKVKCVGICGTDIRIVQNGLPGVSEQSPRILGHEISGVIVAAGRSVKSYRAGMRVAIAPNMGCGTCKRCIRGDQHLCANYQALGVQLDGGFAEYVKVPEQAVRSGNVFELPESIDFEAASINEPLSCVYNGIRQCPIAIGDRVLIIGAGPIGMMYAMMAKLAGASSVFISNRSIDRLRMSAQLDASFIPIEASMLREKIHELTNGEGVEVCVTANPSPETHQLAVELVSMHGKINFFGGLPRAMQEVKLNTNQIHYKQLLVTGSTKANNEHYRKTLELVSGGMLDVKKLITSRYALSDIHAAIDQARSARGNKTIITFE